MGSVYRGIPKTLAAFMQKEYGLSVFIETGTYMASTALWAADIFKEVYTIELSDVFYQRAIRKYGNITNIKFLQGLSSAVLNNVLSAEIPPALFWLDAHWSGGDTAGEDTPCPLIDEVKLILKANSEHFILIDDARQILSAPPESLKKPSDLPTLNEVIGALDSLGPRYTIIWRDVIISVPIQNRESIYHFIDSKGDILFIDSILDFEGCGIGLIIRLWKYALRGLWHLPSALCRSINARINKA
jgi:hypothetical protein